MPKATWGPRAEAILRTARGSTGGWIARWLRDPGSVIAESVAAALKVDGLGDVIRERPEALTGGRASWLSVTTAIVLFASADPSRIGNRDAYIRGIALRVEEGGQAADEYVYGQHARHLEAAARQVRDDAFRAAIAEHLPGAAPVLALAEAADARNGVDPDQGLAWAFRIACPLMCDYMAEEDWFHCCEATRLEIEGNPDATALDLMRIWMPVPTGDEDGSTDPA